MRVVRGLCLSSRPKHLRELAKLYNTSVSGMSDIIRRLNELGVLKETKEKNRRCFELVINDEERSVLNNFFLLYEAKSISERSLQYSKGAADKLEGMDEAYSFYKSIKSRKR